MNLNSNSPSFPTDHDLHHHLFAPNHQSGSSSSLSSSSAAYGHVFFNTTQDHTGHYHRRQLYHHPHDLQKSDKCGYDGAGSSYEIKNNTVNSGLKLTLWKKDHEDQRSAQNISEHPLQGMSSKIRLIPRMNNPDNNNAPKIGTIEGENDLIRKTCSYNSNSPIRVCSDCNTTKTPLWRSGPKGPKSLCNACGIRQRKARRAAAMAATANGTVEVASDHRPQAMKIKLIKHNKDKTDKNWHSNLPIKKRCKMTAGINGQKKKLSSSSFEDLLINLSNNISFHRVFPDDEKDAAILLMALSSGLLHG